MPCDEDFLKSEHVDPGGANVVLAGRPHRTTQAIAIRVGGELEKESGRGGVQTRRGVA